MTRCGELGAVGETWGVDREPTTTGGLGAVATRGATARPSWHDRSQHRADPLEHRPDVHIQILREAGDLVRERESAVPRCTASPH